MGGCDFPSCRRWPRCWPSRSRRSRADAELRAQVGRLPVDRLPRRRRGGVRQPQRAAADPVLPRAGRGGRPNPAGAVRAGRGDRHPRRRRAGGSTSRRCCSGSTPPRAGSGCWPSRPRPGSSPSTCSRWARSTTPSGSSTAARGARGGDDRRPGRRSTSPRPPGTGSWPPSGSASSRARGWTGIDRQAAGRDLRAGQAGHVQGQARADGRLRGGRVPAAQERRRTRSGRCCSACTTTRASWPAWA